MSSTLNAGHMGQLVSSHRNTEGELITIEQVRGGEFAGQHLLCIYDDDTPTVAPTLLDEATVAWLRQELPAVFGADPEVYVVFDGPPGHESGRFVEVEDADGQGVAVGAEWAEHGDLWRLGPFTSPVAS